MSITDSDFTVLVSTPFSIAAYVIVILVAMVSVLVQEVAQDTIQEYGRTEHSVCVRHTVPNVDKLGRVAALR